GASTVDIPTGANGVARCFWRLGDEAPVQVLTAMLLAGGAPVEPPVVLAFTANLERGRQDAPGLHVTEVVTLAHIRPLLNDSLVEPDDLVEGVAVVLDGTPVPGMVDGKPVLTLTLDLPFPIAAEEQA